MPDLPGPSESGLGVECGRSVCARRDIRVCALQRYRQFRTHFVRSSEIFRELNENQ